MSLPKEAIVPEYSTQVFTVCENPEIASIGILVKFFGF
jgi:hypothetical protein